jgi:hypothetical protein
MNSDRSDRIRYEPPAIEQREPLSGLLSAGTLISDVKPDGNAVAGSDVNVKENIRPVRW